MESWGLSCTPFVRCACAREILAWGSRLKDGGSAVPNYDLLLVAENRMVFAVAKDRDEALALFGAELGQRLALKEQDTVAPYMMDEWDESPYWSNSTIPVYVISD